MFLSEFESKLSHGYYLLIVVINDPSMVDRCVKEHSTLERVNNNTVRVHRRLVSPCLTHISYTLPARDPSYVFNLFKGNAERCHESSQTQSPCTQLIIHRYPSLSRAYVFSLSINLYVLIVWGTCQGPPPRVTRWSDIVGSGSERRQLSRDDGHNWDNVQFVRA
jgi:hypothetical protein